jgi:hypothetical protein
MYPLTRALEIAQRSNRLVNKLRKRITKRDKLLALSDMWLQTFDALSVVVLAIFFVIIAAGDCFLLLPLYEQVSKSICGNPLKLHWVLAVMIVLVLAALSHFIAQSLPSGPFMQWEITKHKNNMPESVVKNEVAQIRSTRRVHAAFFSAVFLVIMYCMLSLRDLLAEKVNAPLEGININLAMNYVGMGLLFFELLTGMYLIPVLQFVFFETRIIILKYSIGRDIAAIQEMDRDVYQLWVHGGRPTTWLTTDLRGALTRFFNGTEGSCGDMAMAGL